MNHDKQPNCRSNPDIKCLFSFNPQSFRNNGKIQMILYEKIFRMIDFVYEQLLLIPGRKITDKRQLAGRGIEKSST